MATSVELSEAIAEKREFSIRTERIEKLVKKLDDCGNPELRAIALELVQSVVELHGAALARILERVSRTLPGEQALEEAIEDDLVASVLLLHGLHPDPLETQDPSRIGKGTSVSSHARGKRGVREREGRCCANQAAW